jgi:hypothetical protein
VSARSMKIYDPDAAWKRAEEPLRSTAREPKSR